MDRGHGGEETSPRLRSICNLIAMCGASVSAVDVFCNVPSPGSNLVGLNLSHRRYRTFGRELSRTRRLSDASVRPSWRPACRGRGLSAFAFKSTRVQWELRLRATLLPHISFCSHHGRLRAHPSQGAGVRRCDAGHVLRSGQPDAGGPLRRAMLTIEGTRHACTGAGGSKQRSWLIRPGNGIWSVRPSQSCRLAGSMVADIVIL